jgi:hypothetical protein
VTTSGGSDPGFSGASASRDLGGELLVVNTAAGDLPLVRETVELGSPLISPGCEIIDHQEIASQNAQNDSDFLRKTAEQVLNQGSRLSERIPIGGTEEP